MGQTIVIESTEIIDDSVIVTMNRSLTSQVGEGYDSLADATGGDSFGASLAQRIFEVDDAISRVYVASNALVVTRPSGWDDRSIETVSSVAEDLLLFYPAA